SEFVFMSPPGIAIVGVGGLFPSFENQPTTPERLWQLVLAAADTARHVPPGRWLLDPETAYAAEVGKTDHVYSRRGCFLDPFDVGARGPALPPDLVSEPDPLFCLTLRAGTEAWRSAQTQSLDHRRVGVILGALALPTEKASEIGRNILGGAFAERTG